MRTFVMFLSIVMLIGCGSPTVKVAEEQAPPLSEFVDLPFNKFVNRLYIDDVKDKYAKISADFGYLWPSQNVGGYPPDKWIRISIIKGSMRYDNVMVPKSEA